MNILRSELKFHPLFYYGNNEGAIVNNKYSTDTDRKTKSWFDNATFKENEIDLQTQRNERDKKM